MSASAEAASAAGKVVKFKRLVLFDIDGTLLSAGPAARMRSVTMRGSRRPSNA